jgi:hypothetical protein
MASELLFTSDTITNIFSTQPANVRSAGDADV